MAGAGGDGAGPAGAGVGADTAGVGLGAAAVADGVVSGGRVGAGAGAEAAIARWVFPAVPPPMGATRSEPPEATLRATCSACFSAGSPGELTTGGLGAVAGRSLSVPWAAGAVDGPVSERRRR